MLTFKNDMSFWCDVDSTLIIWEEGGHTWKPHKKHIELLRRAKARGQFVVVWSAGGGAWSEKAVQMLDIEDCVDICIGKPNWWVDDVSADQILIKNNHIFLKDVDSE